MIDRVRQLYRIFVGAGSSLESPFLLAVRLYWGWQFVQTGWGHLTHLDKVTAYFGQLGIPFPGLNAPFISVLEFVGGMLLVLGLASRPIAFLLTCNMTVAFIMGDREALLSIFSDPDKFYAAAPYTFLIASLIVLIWGAGKFSLDYFLEKRFEARGSLQSDYPSSRSINAA
jgi:putative oxidoreductase